jgi:hypothetical protein
LERFRKIGLLGWQNSHPFEDVIESTMGVAQTQQKNSRQQVVYWS